MMKSSSLKLRRRPKVGELSGCREQTRQEVDYLHTNQINDFQRINTVMRRVSISAHLIIYQLQLLVNIGGIYTLLSTYSS